MLIFTCRPLEEQNHPFLTLSEHFEGKTEITLQGLRRNSVRELCADMLGVDPDECTALAVSMVASELQRFGLTGNLLAIICLCSMTPPPHAWCTCKNFVCRVTNGSESSPCAKSFYIIAHSQTRLCASFVHCEIDPFYCRQQVISLHDEGVCNRSCCHLNLSHIT